MMIMMTPRTATRRINMLGFICITVLMLHLQLQFQVADAFTTPTGNVGKTPPNGVVVRRQHEATTRTSTTRRETALLSSTTTSTTEESSPSTSPPSPPSPSVATNLAQSLLNWALKTPIWKYVLVPQARKTMAKTAESNDIPWTSSKKWIQQQMEPILDTATTDSNNEDVELPDYYHQPFHAYDDGNLSWDAAYEVEIASCAVGARNFPQYGSNGESAFRGAFDSALVEAGATAPKDSVIVDLGCGTGMSTRRLATNHPQASKIVGIDLSKYFIAVGRRLLELAPIASFQDDNNGPWVSTIHQDDRIQYVVGDAAIASSTLQAGTTDVVNLQFVLHELPPDAARDIIDDAFKLLKPNGQLWICEMDFQAPAYAAQRANPLLFSMIRSTEPYLDEYADSIPSLFEFLQSKSSRVCSVPATGRHFAIVATKPNDDDESDDKCLIKDMRFDEDGNYRVDDTHLAAFWKSKQ
mmetsp:Transcript_334/g.829  ORF Transcript_334/g.829 Transcript_334/m.829 type:complete len:468 (-) Transcript_334:211-1614(-)